MDTRQIARQATLAVLVAALIISPAVAVSGTLLEDYEGSNPQSDWGKGECTIVTSPVKEGEQACKYDTSGTYLQSYLEFSTVKPSEASMYVYFEQFSSDSEWMPSFKFGDSDAGGFSLQVDDAGKLGYYDGSLHFYGTLPKNEWVKFHITNIDYGGNSGTVTAYNSSGGEITSFTANTNGGMAHLDRVDHNAKWSTYSVDYIGYGGNVITSTVSGNVTNTNGAGLESADVSTNTSVSTTTASDGSWSMDLGDGTYEITASKSGYEPDTKTVSVSGATSGVDFALSGRLSGTITGVDGEPIDGAVVSTGTNVSTTTDSSGQYDLGLTDGDYTLTVETDNYGDKTVDVTVNGSTTKDVAFARELGFRLDDRSGSFADDPTLNLERPDGTVSGAGFNHNNVSYHSVVNGRTYDLRVISDDASNPAVYTYEGYTVLSSTDEALITVPELNNSTVDDEELSLDERLDLRFSELEDELGGTGTAISMRSPEPVEEVDYTIVDGDGDPIYNGSESFDEPTTQWEGRISDDVSGSVSDDAELEYEGVYGDGTEFNGTSVLSGTLDSTGSTSGPIGPTGSSSGGPSTATTVGGIALLAGGAVVAYRRFGDGGPPSFIPGA